MIITATSKKDAIEARNILVEKGYTYKCSIYWSEEWRKDDNVVFLHKGYDNREKMNHEWRVYTA